MAEAGTAMSPLPTLALATVVLAGVMFIMKAIFFSTPKLNLPPGPPGKPIIGNLKETRGPQSYVKLAELAKKYGPIYKLKSGVKTIIVIADSEVAHEALVKDAQSFSSRPMLKSRLNYAGWRSVSSAEYGPYWRGIRKNLVTHVLSTKQVASMTILREDELDTMVQRIQSEAAKNDNVVKFLPHCRFAIFSVLLHVCFGQKFDSATVEEIDAIFNKILVLLTPQVVDFFPITKPFSKHRTECQQLLRRVKKDFNPLIDEHRKLRASGQSRGDYVDSLLSLQKDPELNITDTDLIALIGEVITGGTDTTSNTLEWAMGHLMQHPEIQTRLYEEIRGVAGDEPLSESDLNKLPYLQAVVKETLRLYPSQPFGISHGLSKQTKLRGYDIPQDAVVLVHVHSIQHDPSYWENAEDFRPERFLEPSMNYDMTTSHGPESMHLFPFGGGRRICPGMSLGLRNAYLLLARCLQKFEWSTVNPGEDVDMEAHLTSTLNMKNRLLCRVTERNT